MTSSTAQIRRFTGPYGPCLELTNAYGRAVLALQGAQLLSWTPLGQSDVFWLTATPAAMPAPLRGGVPICWPWFARQGVPASSPQHGIVRTLPWKVIESHTQGELVSITLAPDWQQCPTDHKAVAESNLGVPVELLALTQTVVLHHDLSQHLLTRNLSKQPIRLTQALHSYFLIGDARQVHIDGLQGKAYLDKLHGFDRFEQSNPFAFEAACDRIYLETGNHFVLHDPVLCRTITLHTAHSESLVVWNPGANEGSKMADVGPQQWSQYFCFEASHAEPHGRILLEDCSCLLSQVIEVKTNA